MIPSKPRLPTFTDIPNVWPGAELGPITLPSSIFVDYICLDFIICVYRKSKFVHRMQIVSRTKSFPFSRRFVAEYERRCVRRDLCLSLTDELFTNFKSIAVSVFFFASLAAVTKGLSVINCFTFLYSPSQSWQRRVAFHRDCLIFSLPEC